MKPLDTIVAISSAVGQAARMIVRLSGERAWALASHLCGGEIAIGVSRRNVRIHNFSIPAWVYSFHAPKSYTGEDLIEFHIPGNPLLAQWLVEDLLTLGARAAEPGEFTARAYFNGKIDLSAAEGIAATIAAQNEQELAAARQLLAGELARRLREPMELLAQTLGLVEVGIDFSDEDVSFLSRAELLQRTEKIDAALNDLLVNSARFERLTHEVQIVLVGRPNAGKSTLLNALAGHERAVVSPVAGTTRDAISARVALNRGYVQITDVAGLDDSSPKNDIERQMQERARETIDRADVVVLLRDVTDPRPAMEMPRRPDLGVWSKIDQPESDISNLKSQFEIAVSAVTGANISVLRDRLDELAFGKSASGGLALNARHLRCIDDARAALARAKDQTRDELIAFELRGALDSLGQILGVVSPDEVLGQIFATFCIGK